MKKSALILTFVFSSLLLLLTISGLAHTQSPANADPVFILPGREPIDSGGGSLDLPVDDLSDAGRQAIQAELNQNMAQLAVDGLLMTDETTAVSLSWPLSASNGLDDYGYHGISGFVDHDSRYGYLLDYACGDRTYDVVGYNHKGTDFFTWPFAWNKMDNDEVVVVVAAPGTIIGKRDGNYDRSCAMNNGDWNAVYVRHNDGSIAWYGHLKNGSLTSKSIGDTVITGEVLGVVGSSGSSTGPHLHLELYTNATFTTLVDPYSDNCNTSSSWWQAQRPYDDSAVNKVMTGSAPVEWTTCPNPTIINEKTEFVGGDDIYFTTFYRDQLAGQTSQYTIYQPNGSIYDRWTGSISAEHYASSWWWWGYSLPADAMSGDWTFEVVFNGQTYETTFQVSSYIHITAPAGIVFWQPGSVMSITWQDNLPGDVQIDLLKSGIVSTTLALATPSDGSYVWTIPMSSSIGLGYQIRIADVTDTAVSATSQHFAIGSQEQFDNLFLPLTLK
ncbi:MAG: peptidoglycan DD-metalloendopeptidase family protein [Ardenticatenaceae bacterium]|nr:peptidoglycan DD-metalloendopeptidase family protein [Ardenticatenaceae bacterium]